MRIHYSVRFGTHPRGNAFDSEPRIYPTSRFCELKLAAKAVGTVLLIYPYKLNITIVM